MRVATPEMIYLKDYRPSDFQIPEIRLTFQLFEDRAVVRARLSIVPQGDVAHSSRHLVLNGEKLKLTEIKLNDKPLASNEYAVSERFLTLPNLSEASVLETTCEILPHQNATLEGLYKSGGLFCTQNEPEGFRKITYFLDRPDVMSRYWTRIEADKERYPVLLSNGNPVGAGDLDHERHYAEWDDPYPKPSYLFALVAGRLVCREDRFLTKSGKNVSLRIYVEKGNEEKTTHAMECLKKAMRWDEETFGLECDLNTYMIVAVKDFNFGAMENKGLNIFNSQYILADPETATDHNFQAILGVIGHEYFHNWTGNRVTCRDWFQITLKEGLTIFRDQEFTADMTARSVKRIHDVRDLRDHQFIEDAGPNAHPIRPESYIEVNNFYTVTVYEKGAEVIRMIETLIGKDAFRNGMRKYFELYDGKAVTTEDFIHAMEQASGKDLTPFKKWYQVAGTPICKVQMEYLSEEQRVILRVRQELPGNLSMESAGPFYFPLCVGLMDREGREIPIRLKGEEPSNASGTKVLTISKQEDVFEFIDIPSEPIPSLLRNFSAPVYLEYGYCQEDLAFLLAHDTDDFNRYDAGQRLALNALNRLIDDAYQRLDEITVKQSVLQAFGDLIHDTKVDAAFKAEALTLPSLATVTERMDITDFEAAFAAREFLKRTLAESYEDSLTEIYENLHQIKSFQLDAASIGNRSLKNTVLAYLLSLKTPDHIARASTQYELAKNMTDRMAALALLCNVKTQARERCLADFYSQWKHNDLVMNKWFAAQAASQLPDTLNQVLQLEKDKVFEIRNPNKIRALFGVFSNNLLRFHDQSGQGYAYIADKISQIDDFNPSAASHLAAAYEKYEKLDAARKTLMEKQLRRLLSKKDLSGHTYEIVSKTLGEK